MPYSSTIPHNDIRTIESFCLLVVEPRSSSAGLLSARIKQLEACELDGEPPFNIPMFERLKLQLND